MTPARLLLALTLACLSASPVLLAQSTTPTPPSGDPADPTRRPAVDVTGPSERVSRFTAAAVTAGITYSPPPPAPEKKAEQHPDDPQNAENPKNGIVRLPKYIVEGERPPVFRERDINTTKGLGEIAVKRYLSEAGKALNRYTLPFIGLTKEQYALMMYQEDERLQNLKDVSEDVYILRQTDPGAADQLQREVDRTFIRRSEFVPVSSGQK
jgi:hypothetical protein